MNAAVDELHRRAAPRADGGNPAGPCTPSGLKPRADTQRTPIDLKRSSVAKASWLLPRLGGDRKTRFGLVVLEIFGNGPRPELEPSQSPPASRPFSTPKSIMEYTGTSQARLPPRSPGASWPSRSAARSLHCLQREESGFPPPLASPERASGPPESG